MPLIISLCRRIALLTVGVYSRNNGVFCSIGISITRRFQKSAWASVCNGNKNLYSSFVINSRIIIHMSNERAWHPLQENEAIFSKKIDTFLYGVFEELRSCLLILLLAVEFQFAYQVKWIDGLCKKIKCYFPKI